MASVITVAPTQVHIHRPPHAAPTATIPLPAPFQSRHPSASPHLSSVIALAPPLLLLSASTTLTFVTLTAPPPPPKSFSLPYPLSALTVTPRHVVAATSAGAIFIWSHTGILLAISRRFHAAIHHLSYSHPNLLIAVDTALHIIPLHSLLSPKHDETSIRRLRGHTLPIVFTTAGPSTVFAVSLSADRTARIWHAPSSLCLCTLRLPSPPVTACLSPDDSTAFIGAKSGHVFRLDIRGLVPGTVITPSGTSTRLRVLREPSEDGGAVRDLCLVDHALHVAAESGLETVDLETGVVTARYTRHGTGGVHAVRVWDDPSKCATTVSNSVWKVPASIGRAVVPADDILVSAGGDTFPRASVSAAWNIIDMASRRVSKQHADTENGTGNNPELVERIRMLEMQVESLSNDKRQLEAAGRKLLKSVRQMDME